MKLKEIGTIVHIFCVNQVDSYEGKIIARTHSVVILIYQVSDKRLPLKCGIRMES
ncbi:MAG TPA: hypothetical protein VHI78_13155 [Bacteroidales bacterium]|nr:hypothetical protein [Bacteroidales bacterium]